MTSGASRPAPIKVLDLFAGCGGLTQGFHEYRPAGTDAPVFHTVGAVEWDRAAAATFAMNFGPAAANRQGVESPLIVCDDITGWEPPWAPGQVDVVVGGPPCQGFSGLNRRKVRAERNLLWLEFIHVVEALQPKVFVIENVDRFLRSVEFKDLQSRVGHGRLKDYELVRPHGYEEAQTDWERDKLYLLNAADFGSPQARRRAIVMGVRKHSGVAEMRYPERTHSRLGEPGTQQWVTVDELFKQTSGLELEPDLPVRPLSTVEGLDGKFAGPYRTSELHIERRPEPLSLSRYKAIPPKGNRKDLRGRYACRIVGGEELIIEQLGPHRGADNQLLVFGGYQVVWPLSDMGQQVTVRRIEPLDAASGTSGRRSRSERFRADVVHRGVERTAELEYLSTLSWDLHDKGSGDVMGRLRPDSPSVTIRTEFFKPEKGRYLHPTEDRPLTHLEAARLQGFPDNFQWYGSKIDIARQIGNAVPIPLGRKIAQSIYEYLASPSAATG
ncbi:DNA cytosine methyltransferase [Cellulosimicrobium aquatile]|uniref:DNA cytosine methyltransferase n=1 Tax=Cellulosimicrobium aquatile TaxID=1612203 RepID=UPI001F0FA205|nr:DNA cytosine methyltransferase [Cellulosimicrobium aquatile]